MKLYDVPMKIKHISTTCYVSKYLSQLYSFSKGYYIKLFNDYIKSFEILSIKKALKIVRIVELKTFQFFRLSSFISIYYILIININFI